MTGKGAALIALMLAGWMLGIYTESFIVGHPIWPFSSQEQTSEQKQREWDEALQDSSFYPWLTMGLSTAEGFGCVPMNQRANLAATIIQEGLVSADVEAANQEFRFVVDVLIGKAAQCDLSYMLAAISQNRDEMPELADGFVNGARVTKPFPRIFSYSISGHMERNKATVVFSGGKTVLYEQFHLVDQEYKDSLLIERRRADINGELLEIVEYYRVFKDPVEPPAGADSAIVHPARGYYVIDNCVGATMP